MLRPIAMFLIAAIAAMPLSAKKKKEESKEDKYADYYIEAYLKDGSVIKGYNRTNFTGGAEQLEISAAPKGKADRYDSELVDSIVFPPSDTDQRRVVWETMYAQPWMMKGLFNQYTFALPSTPEAYILVASPRPFTAADIAALLTADASPAAPFYFYLLR